jgi:4-amino-4-deoxy-L-arabinose transferase-like glycosyltransferase
MRWHSPPAVVGAILAVILLHVVTRLLAGPALGVDDAEQALFAQAWSLNYRLSHPPLYTWLMVALDRTVGLELPTFALFRAAILGAGWLVLYKLALDALPDPRLAALAAASYALIFKLIYEAQTELAHALLGATLIAVTLVVFAGLVRRPTTGRYLLLGVVFALGLLAKWNTGIFIVALLAAGLIRADLRARVLDRRMALALLVMALLITPSAAWIALHWQAGTVAGVVYATPPAETSTLSQMLAGFGAVLISALAFPEPFLVAFLALFATRLTRPSRPAGTIDARFLALVCGLGLVPFVLMVPLAGVTSFPERWMLVTLLPLPVVLFGFVRPGGLDPWRVRAFLGLAALAVVAAMGVRIASAQLGAWSCNKCRTLIDFPAVAEALRQRGFERGTIVVAPDQFHLGGNLRLQFPDSRLIAPQSPLSTFPAPTEGGQCLLIRRGDSANPAGLEASLRGFAVEALGVPAGAAWQTGRVRVPIAGAGTTPYLVDFDLLSPGAGDCH